VTVGFDECERGIEGSEEEVGVPAVEHEERWSDGSGSG
jgi:hypothetical protein